jgi:hypothetical protein
MNFSLHLYSLYWYAIRMSAGTIVINYIDCNARDGCLQRLTARGARLAEGASLEQVRRAARELGWQVGVPREDDYLGAGRRNSRQDYCPIHKKEAATA